MGQAARNAIAAVVFVIIAAALLFAADDSRRRNERTPPPEAVAPRVTPAPGRTVPSATVTTRVTPRPTVRPRPTTPPGRIGARGRLRFDSRVNLAGAVTATMTLVNRGGRAMRPKVWVHHGDAMNLVGCDPRCTVEADALGTAILSWGRLDPGESREVTIGMQAVRIGRVLWDVSIDANGDGSMDYGSEPLWELVTTVLL